MPSDFQDLEIWKEANRLAIEIYKITKSFPREEQFALSNQMRRSAVSVSANIAEGCGRFGIQDRVQLFIIARGSIFETRSHLSIAIGLGYIDKKVFIKIDEDYAILVRRLGAFIQHQKSIKLK